MPRTSRTVVKTLAAKTLTAKTSVRPSVRTAAKAVVRTLPVLAFKSLRAWESWLAEQPTTSAGVWLKLAKTSAKTSTGVASVSRQEAIDGALCHGWIDGQFDSFDHQWWLIRFTPRKPTSRWSQNNRKRALVLIEEQRMTKAGLAQIERAKADGRWDHAYAGQSKAIVPPDLAAALAGNNKARIFFDGLDSHNRYAVLYRIHTAKKPETRARHIATFVAMLDRGETIYPRKRKS